ncbi:MAG: hypothetical protein C0495_02140 [Acinetobacter sp.]|nr:hypothetical protein [Acinetobacter sp.]
MNSTNDFLVFLYNSFYSSRIQSFKNHHFLLYLHLAKKLDLSLTPMHNTFFERYNPSHSLRINES